MAKIQDLKTAHRFYTHEVSSGIIEEEYRVSTSQDRPYRDYTYTITYRKEPGKLSAKRSVSIEGEKNALRLKQQSRLFRDLKKSGFKRDIPVNRMKHLIREKVTYTLQEAPNTSVWPMGAQQLIVKNYDDDGLTVSDSREEIPAAKRDNKIDQVAGMVAGVDVLVLSSENLPIPYLTDISMATEDVVPYFVDMGTPR